MNPNFPQWLAAQGYTMRAQTNYVSYGRRLEQSNYRLDECFSNGTYQQNIIDSLEYSRDDERSNRPNPSNIEFEGDVDLYTNLQSYKSAAKRYFEFLSDSEFDETTVTLPDTIIHNDIIEADLQKLSLEKDMQKALRRNIGSLNESLRIIDDNKERPVDSGRIDITCEDDEGIVVIELKAGIADSSAIGQILGYMGDLQEEEGGKSVRGILVAHDFNRRAKSAARAVPTLTLKKYSIEFKFTAED